MPADGGRAQATAGAPPPQRLAAADTFAGRLAGLRHDADTLLVVSVSDPAGGGAHACVAIAVGPGFPAGTELMSASTGRVPFRRTRRRRAHAAWAAGIEAPVRTIGQSWGTTSGATSLERRQARYADLDVAARQVRRAVPLVMVPAVAAAAVLFSLGGALLAFGTRTGRPRLVARGRLGRPAHRLLHRRVAGGVLPGQPRAVVAGPAAGGAGRRCPRRLVRRRPGRGRVRGAATIRWGRSRSLLWSPSRFWSSIWPAAHTCNLSSVLGYNPLVGGRFSGIGNPAFGALAASALLTATLLAVRLPRPVLTVAVIGAVAV